MPTSPDTERAEIAVSDLIARLPGLDVPALLALGDATAELLARPQLTPADVTALAEAQQADQ